MHSQSLIKKQTDIGYTLGVFGVILVLIWIGVYKFTPTEAELIKPLIVNHPLMSWLYNIFSVQVVSNLVGSVEIIIAIGLIVGFKVPKIAFISGIAAAGVFIATLSFLITTPGAWKVSDGILVTNFFLVKDILFLAIAISVIEKNKHAI